MNMAKLSDYFTSLLVTTTFIGIVLTIGWVFITMYPNQARQVDAVVPTNKSVYSPGERVGFKLRKCDTMWEYKKISFQLESEKYHFISLGEKEDLTYPLHGCVEAMDWSMTIPEDILEYMEPGRYRIFVTVRQIQNSFKEPVVYKTDWFIIQ
jgi:hypothetical protein